MIKVSLGCIARCSIAGITGTLASKVEMLTGTVQYSLQPKIKDDSPDPGKMPEATNVDYQLLEFVDAGVMDRVLIPETTHIELGNEVECMASGMRGVAVVKYTFINGCIYYHIQPKQSKKQRSENVMPDRVFLPSKTLRVHGEGIAQPARANLEKPVSQRTGGPMTPAMRIG